ncbi:hypothetical protein [Neobacillus bataviensis]|uniref:hypothetical protein n=1 Tax=Neobacillus bataviensis TaxID=220685 RepID=UPI001CBA988B|nr:hypothetical protein [Neobacillus bataviensis]
MLNENNKPENSSDPSGMEQPLLSTGSTEAGFNWNSDDKEQAQKPRIGNTVVGEDGQ